MSKGSPLHINPQIHDSEKRKTKSIETQQFNNPNIKRVAITLTRESRNNQKLISVTRKKLASIGVRETEQQSQTTTLCV